MTIFRSIFGKRIVILTPTFLFTCKDDQLVILNFKCKLNLFCEITSCCSDNLISVTPRIRCARCLPVIRRRCHVICLCVAFYHVIMCISFRMCVRLMHPSIFPVVRFAIRRSYVLRRPPLLSFREWVLNFLGMA